MIGRGCFEGTRASRTEGDVVRTGVVIVEDDLIVASHVGRGVAARDELALFGSAATLTEARGLMDAAPVCSSSIWACPTVAEIELIETIRARGGGQPKILVLSVLGDEETVLAAVLAGADGYLLKDLDSLDIGQQAVDALAGDAPLSPSIAGYVLRHLRRQEGRAKPDDSDPVLSPREIELLQLLARGYSNKAAAPSSGSPRTPSATT